MEHQKGQWKKHYAPGKTKGLVGRGDSHNIFEVSMLRLGTECEAGWNLIADTVLLRASGWVRDIVGLGVVCCQR